MNPDLEDPEAKRPLDLWGRIRRDYLAGASAAVVSERYGVSQRTIQRRASAQGWRRCDRNVDEEIDPAWPVPPPRGVYSPRRTMADVLDHNPSLEGVCRVNSVDLDELLLRPDPETLRHFAFKRAAESAVMGRPAEALSWMRLVGAVERSGDRIESEESRFSRADRMRAAFIGAIDRHLDDLEDEGDSPGRADPER